MKIKLIILNLIIITGFIFNCKASEIEKNIQITPTKYELLTIIIYPDVIQDFNRGDINYKYEFIQNLLNEVKLDIINKRVPGGIVNIFAELSALTDNLINSNKLTSDQKNNLEIKLSNLFDLIEEIK